MKNDNDNKDRLIKEWKYQICILNKKDEFEFFEVNKNSTKEEIFRIIEKSLPIAQRKELNKYFNEKPVKKW